MSKYARDIKAIRDADATKAILTCHDEYPFASMVQGVDGALVGFASAIPQLIIDLWNAVKAGDLHKAMAVQAKITPIKEAVYGAGEPTGEAHARMKAAMRHAGVIANDHVRPPTHAPSAQELEVIKAALAQAGLLKVSRKSGGQPVAHPTAKQQESRTQCNTNHSSPGYSRLVCWRRCRRRPARRAIRNKQVRVIIPFRRAARSIPWPTARPEAGRADRSGVWWRTARAVTAPLAPTRWPRRRPMATRCCSTPLPSLPPRYH